MKSLIRTDLLSYHSITIFPSTQLQELTTNVPIDVTILILNIFSLFEAGTVILVSIIYLYAQHKWVQASKFKLLVSINLWKIRHQRQPCAWPS